MSERKNFDAVASTWDEQPQRVEMARKVSAAILSNVKFGSSADIMDFGCGTGLVSMFMQPHVRSIVGVDTSQGMLDGLMTKVKTMDARNVSCKKADVMEAQYDIGGPYTHIISSMAMHHVEDIPKLLDVFNKHLCSSGQVALVDLDPDNGEFHPDSTGVFHHGFERGVFTSWLSNAGFGDIHFSNVTQMMRDVKGVKKPFSIFLAVATKLL